MNVKNNSKNSKNPKNPKKSFSEKTQSPLKEAWSVFIRNKSAIAGLFILGAIILLTLYGQLFYGEDPFEIKWLPFTSPGTEPGFLLGTDYLGRDLLAGLIKGGGPTLAVGFSAATLTTLIGMSMGAFAGFFGGKIDAFLVKITEFFQVLPALLFAMVLIAVFSPKVITIVLAIGMVSWPATARLTRTEFLRIRELEYVTAARSIGMNNFRIMFSVILPNALPPLIVSATLSVGIAILFESGLSFLGLGDPNVMSWGLMIGSNRNYILEAWWPVAVPGVFIFLTVLSVSLIGDGLTDAFNPKLRER